MSHRFSQKASKTKWNKKNKTEKEEDITYLKKEICLSDIELENVKRSEEKHKNCPTEVGPMGRTQNTVIFSKTMEGITVKRQCGRCKALDDITEPDRKCRKEIHRMRDDDWRMGTYMLSDEEAERAAAFLDSHGTTIEDKYDVLFSVGAWWTAVNIKCGAMKEDISDEDRFD